MLFTYKFLNFGFSLFNLLISKLNFAQSAATIAVTSSSTSSRQETKSTTETTAAAGQKRQQKPYGKRQDSTGATSRSRSATKELERKNCFFNIF